VSKERGRMTPVAEEAYSLRDLMSKVTGVAYDVREALPDFPPPADHASWYLLGREFRGPKGVAHADTVWEDRDGRVFIESMYVGNTTEWIEPVYGEKGVIALMKIEHPDVESARKSIAEKFPTVEKRLRYYERTIADISSERKVSLGLRSVGKGGFTSFIVAKIEAKGLAEEEKEKIFKQNVDALKAAWDKIMRYDERMLKSL